NVTDRTIEFWFKTDDITSRQVIYEEGGGTHSISIFLEDDRIYYTAYRNSADLSSRRRSFRSGDEDIEVGKWFHVAFVLEGGTTLKWYLNGIEQDSQAGLTVPSHSGDVNLGLSGDDIRFPSSLDSADWDNSSIGTSSSETYDGTYGAIDTADYNYSGNISLFRIWNVARTEAQIDDNKSDFLTSGTSLVAYSDQDRIYYVPNGATAISLTAFVALNTQSTTIPDTDAINLQNTRDRTIEFRFKATDMTTRQVLYEEGGNVNAIVAFIEAGRFYFSAYRNNAGIAADRRFFRSGDGDVVFNTWYHVAITLEDTDAGDANPPTSGLELKWYLDGVEQDSQNGIQIDNHNGDINLGLTDGAIRYPDTLLDVDWSASSIGSSTSQTYNGGESSSSSANNFSGDFDLFRIWNVARTQSEIDTNKDVLLTSETDLVAYQSGTQMNYQPNGGTSITESVDAVGVITWDGSDSNVWTTTTNWVGDTAPNATRKQKVAIPDGGIDPILTTEISVGFLTINTGVELIIQDGATLNVYYGLDNNGTITVENGGSLIYHNCQSAITGSGSFSINRNTPSYGVNDFYSYWSSPVIPSNSNIATVFPDAELIYRFNSDVANSDWVLHGTSDFSSGVGYAIQNEGLGGQLRNFQGKINEADITVPVFDTTNLAGEGSDEIEWSTSGDNLVGNPFSSALSWDIVVRDSINKNINGTIYFWDQSIATNGENEVGDYKSYNATGGGTPSVTGNIGSGQAFFVKTDSNGSISFKPTHQVAGSNTQFYKTANKKESVTNKMDGRSWFNIHHNNKINTILIGFLNGATEGYDRMYDGLFDTNQQELGFYSILPNGKAKTSIQGLPKLFLEEHRVKLGYIVDKIGTYKIDINQEYINKDYHIYIIDKNTNTIQDLRISSYTFNIDEIGENENRFEIIYKKSKVLDIEDIQIEQNKNFIAYVNNSKELILDTEFDNEIISYTKIFDLQGREIASFKQKERKDISQLSSGIYIVKLILNDNSILSKKTLFD
ncbi:MAG: LamG-like jellyroll fold domain-containing protein, partial [Polaribacter sp.]